VLRTAAELFRRRGYHGTGINRILEESRAPSGSLYFHFPGGKTELAVETVTAEGRQIGQGIEYLLESSDDVAEAVGRVVDFLAGDLRDSNYERGCPVGTVALDVASDSEPIRLACRAIFEGWTVTIERRLRTAGWTEEDAAAEALVVVALIEGALLLARTRQDTEPLEAVAHHVRAMVTRPSIPSRGTAAGSPSSRTRARRRPAGGAPPAGS
jgi:TetR/AcrR family transcriptional repressor of lmrAB and yxaGH operons